MGCCSKLPPGTRAKSPAWRPEVPLGKGARQGLQGAESHLQSLFLRLRCHTCSCWDWGRGKEWGGGMHYPALITVIPPPIQQ